MSQKIFKYFKIQKVLTKMNICERLNCYIQNMHINKSIIAKAIDMNEDELNNLLSNDRLDVYSLASICKVIGINIGTIHER